MSPLKTVCIIASFLFMGMVGVQAASVDDDGKKETVLIPIRPITNKSMYHRAPASVPVVAEYDGWSSAVVVTFSRSVGDVTVAVMNMTTGEYVNRSLDSIGMVSIPVSGSDGIYTITVTLSSGTQYFGQFTL